MSLTARISSDGSGLRSHGTIVWRTQRAYAHALIAQDSHSTIFNIFFYYSCRSWETKLDLLIPVVISAPTVHLLRYLIFNPPFMPRSIQFIEDISFFTPTDITVNGHRKPDNFDLPYKYLIGSHDIIFRRGILMWLFFFIAYICFL